ncbi:MAG: ferrous iron transport protein B [Bacillota bacterium]|jgi:ferrous iron transport protein B|nr:ferrous iron transport protein B [Candidatus Fermentithermobacillaceae bacterium]
MSMSNRPLLVALAGNPNVGKSTVFNALTGLRQHTGNWTGKTVALLAGTVHYAGQELRFVDLPGTYSLRASSREEEVARDFLLHEKPDVTVCVVDATCLERNLNFVLQVLRAAPRCVVCLNLMDEARAHGLLIDTDLLSTELGVPVVPTAARSGEGIADLLETVYQAARGSQGPQDAQGARASEHTDDPATHKGSRTVGSTTTDSEVAAIYREAERIASRVVRRSGEVSKTLTDRLDDIVTSRRFGIPIMLFLLGMVFFITISLANYPSAALSWVLFKVEDALSAIVLSLRAPEWLHGILVLGCYRTVAWVVAVMLPPMAIFFPLFTLLEDFGYLPRVAFNLDHLFHRSGGHGKQALTMSMGFGCNAAGVVAARIIESPRERLIAILTNCFVPCNGRFPTLILLSSIFFRGRGFLGSAGPCLAVLGIILAGVGMTLVVSRMLTATILKGVPSSFVLELPPYRKPEFWKTIARSWKDRTVWVLKRAVSVALPCGAITWLVANTTLNGQTVMAHVAGRLDPLAALLGMDGVILTAFILGFPANEIVIPIALMSYLSQGAMVDLRSPDLIGAVLRSGGWTWTTGLSVLLFSLLHFPCGTTVYTVYQETGSKKWAAMSFLIPTGVACAVLFMLNGIFTLLGLN